MKATIILLIFMCISMVSIEPLFSQDYVPFPLPEAEWKFAVINFNNPTGNIEGFYYNKFEGDTIIGNNTYHKLFQTAINGSEYGYIAGIRQEEESGKIYVRFAASYFCEGQETLLYDFGMQVGDTLKLCLDMVGSNILITSIDSVEMGNYVLKRFHTSTTLSEFQLIEGIGSTGGLLTGWEGWEFGYDELWCFTLDGQAIYPDTSCLITDIHSNLLRKEKQLNIYPNPVRDGQITIDFKNIERHQNMELKCFNVYGNVVHNEQIYPYQEESKVNISKWPKGMYFVVVYSEGKLVGNTKFVVR